MKTLISTARNLMTYHHPNEDAGIKKEHICEVILIFAEPVYRVDRDPAKPIIAKGFEAGEIRIAIGPEQARDLAEQLELWADELQAIKEVDDLVDEVISEAEFATTEAHAEAFASAEVDPITEG